MTDSARIKHTPLVLSEFKAYVSPQVDNAAEVAKDRNGFISKANSHKLGGFEDTFLVALGDRNDGMSAADFKALYKGLVNVIEATDREVPDHIQDDVQSMFDLNIRERGRSHTAEESLAKVKSIHTGRYGEFEIEPGQGMHLDLEYSGIDDVDLGRSHTDTFADGIDALIDNPKASAALQQIIHDCVDAAEAYDNAPGWVQVADLVEVYQDELVRKPIAYGLSFSVVSIADLPSEEVEVFVSPGGEVLRRL